MGLSKTAPISAGPSYWDLAGEIHSPESRPSVIKSTYERIISELQTRCSGLDIDGQQEIQRSELFMSQVIAGALNK